MADGKHLSTKFRELCIADATINGKVGERIYYGEYHPKDNLFPQIVFCIDDLGSETVLSARHVFLRVWIWVAEVSDPSPKIELEILYKAVNDLINRNINTPFDEINIGDDEGLRVVSCVKSSAKDEFVETERKYKYEIIYKIVMSEGETFDPNSEYNGGKAWDHGTSSASSSNSSVETKSSSSSVKTKSSSSSSSSIVTKSSSSSSST